MCFTLSRSAMFSKPLVFLSVRSKILFLSVFYRVFGQQTLYSVAKNRFCAYQLAKPLYIPLQIVAPSKTKHFFELLCKHPNEMNLSNAIGGRLAEMLLHGLCVFLCSPLFDCKIETLFVLRPLLGKNVVLICFLINPFSRLHL